jgi:alpha-glucosidase
MNDPVGRLQGIAHSRDHVRTGFVWSAKEPNAGYSTSSTPWLPGGQTIYGSGANEQMNDSNSQLAFTQDIIALRKENEALRFGKYIPYDSCDDTVLCFGREITGQKTQKLLMMFNFSAQSKTIEAPELIGSILRSTNHARTNEKVATSLTLQPHEGCIIRRGTA